MVKNFLKLVKDEFLNSLYPEGLVCLCCNKELSEKGFLCEKCQKDFVEIKKRCKKCGSPLVNSQTEFCDNCRGKERLFDRAISPFEYSKTPQKLIYKLKYNKEKYIAKVFSQSLVKCFLDENLGKIDFVTCVPLNKERQRERGFNQAEEIAKEFVKKLKENKKIEIEEKYDIIKRVKATSTQAHLTHLERRENLKDAFKLSCSKKELKDKTILIVDDIFTTGTTIEEMAKELKKANPKRIYCLTVCHTSLGRTKD